MLIAQIQQKRQSLSHRQLKHLVPYLFDRRSMIQDDLESLRAVGQLGQGRQAVAFGLVPDRCVSNSPDLGHYSNHFVDFEWSADKLANRRDLITRAFLGDRSFWYFLKEVTNSSNILPGCDRFRFRPFLMLPGRQAANRSALFGLP